MDKEQKPKTGEIIMYTAENGQAEVEVKLSDDTIWLSQTQIAKLLGKDIRTINEHIQNIYLEKELNKDNSTIREFRIVQNEGNRQVTRTVDHFSLDVIISVGYRVKSLEGTRFRIWANKVLKNYLINGYVVNERLLAEHTEKIKELQEVVGFINDKKKFIELSGQAEQLLELINGYSQSLSILKQYDEEKLEIKSKKKPEYELNYADCHIFIERIREKLGEKQEASELFGQERGEQFKGILGALYQTFDGKNLYSTVEEKAANLLYLIIKDHPFSDGNKRIGSLLFIFFLDRNKFLFEDSRRKINDSTLAVLALLIATSNPREKETMIKIVSNLL
jgi:death-on-curing family protein